MESSNLADLFVAELETRARLSETRRDVGTFGPWKLCRDRFAEAECLFAAGASPPQQRLSLALTGNYRTSACAAGGWLILPEEDSADAFWLPLTPQWRRYDPQGRILSEQAAVLADFALTPGSVALSFEPCPEHVLDCVLWRLPGSREWVARLDQQTPLEREAYYLWGSHTVYQRPADLYRHLIAGRVYERNYSWPLRRRICSENDAHALHVVLDGLGLATGNPLYPLLCRQLQLSVIARQDADGGFRHGEWTHDMEAHFRLNASAMHLFLDAMRTKAEPALADAAKRLADYLAMTRNETDVGAWFLHDDLERSVQAMGNAPFKWTTSRALGKSPSNMLVLNTHMDTSIAIDRYGQVVRDTSHQSLVESGRAATRAVLALRPAEWLYRWLFRAIYLTLLPTAAASRLPLPLRALKRIAWKYLLPRLYQIKHIFPRLVMPGGYVDRHLCLDGFAFHYLPINLMDLARYQRRLPDSAWRGLLAQAASFIQESGVRGRWRELAYERYALGFWAEALWQLCQLDDTWHYRAWLVEAVLDLQDEGMGLPPSVLGANREALAQPFRCPQPPTQGVRVVSIPRDRVWEIIWINSGYEVAAAPAWQAQEWLDGTGHPIPKPQQLPARDFIVGRRAPGCET